MNPKVSVIVPAYNVEHKIRECLNSILLQTYDNKEIIVVDDGSTDRTSEICDLFEKKHDCIKVIHQKNKGVSVARNVAMNNSSGTYIVYVGVRTNGWQDKHGEKKLFEVNESGKDTNLFDGLIGGQATNWAGSYMIRTQELFEVYPTREIYPSRFGQNMQILLPLAYKRKFGFIDEPLMIYYLQDTSHSQAATPEERKKKEDLNFYGYRDIYLKMLNMIVKDQKEYNYYLNIIESWKCKHELQKAIFEKNKKQIRYYLKKYKSTGQMTLNEEIDFCTEVYPIKVIMLKIIRRVGIISGNSRRKRN